MKEDNLNWEQKKSIELEKRLPKLSNFLLESGRELKNKEIIDEIIQEEQDKELIEKTKEEEKELKNYSILQKKYDKKNNEFYSLRMEVISLLAKKERRDATEKIVEFILSLEKIYTTRDDLKSEMWIYEEGIYVPQGKSYVMEYCRRILKENYTNHLCNEVISKIQADTYIDIDKFFKSNLIEEVPIENGILNIFTKKLSPFNKEKIFFNKIPIEYDETKTCPHIIKFFKDVLKHENDFKVILELFGYCLLKEYRFEKAFMFIGNGRNGKSKTLSLLKKFIGAVNCCSVPLSQINPSSTSLCELYGRLVNLAGDLSNTDLKHTGTIKQVTGRDLINAKRKFLRDLIFVNYAKLIFACNELPKVYDKSEGFWSRWLLLEFPYRFLSKEELRNIPEKEKHLCKLRDEEIIEKITTKEEMSGLLNESIKSLHNLLRNHTFSYSKGTQEIKDLWIRQSDSFMAFCIDHIEEDYEGYITKKELRKYFSKYIKLHKLKGSSDKSIKITLENNYGVIDSQKKVKFEDSERIWEGIKFKNLDKLNKQQKLN